MNSKTKMTSNSTIPEVSYLCPMNVSINNSDCLSIITVTHMSTESMESTLNLIENVNARQKEKMIMLSIANSYLVHSIGDCIEKFVKPVIGAIGKITLGNQECLHLLGHRK